MTIHVITASGAFTDIIDGHTFTAQKVELLLAFAEYQKALDLLTGSKPPDVKEPEKWGVRAIDIQSVELVDFQKQQGQLSI